MMYSSLHQALHLNSFCNFHRALHPILGCIKYFPQGRNAPISQRYSSWSAYLSSSTPVITMQDILINIHSSTNLPWWAVVGLTTICFRSIVTFPLTVHQHQVAARLANLKKELSGIKDELNKEVTIAASVYNLNLKTSKRIFKTNMQHHYQKCIIRDNCHPFKTVITVIFQIPVWICLSVSLRNLCYMQPHHDTAAEQIYHQLKVEGLFCFSDLTVPDMLIIPVLLCTVNLLLIEMHSLRKTIPNSMMEKILLYGSRSMSIFLAIFATFTPSCVTFYWLCSSMFGFIQNTVLMVPKVRRTLRIPHAPVESATPFQDIKNNFKMKVSKYTR